MDDRAILIVANRTAQGAHLKRLVSDRIASGPCTFTLLVPVTPPADGWIWTEGGAEQTAQDRLEEALVGLKELGAQVEGVLEDGQPMDAVEALMEKLHHVRSQPFEEIILSTLPEGVSRWLKQDLKSRLERRYEIPVTHVAGEVPASVR
jgi:hypothetical protein